MSTLASALKWIKKESKGTRIGTKVRKIAFACMVHRLWSVHNLAVFEGIIPCIDRTVF
jgi:hypothetical protein